MSDDSIKLKISIQPEMDDAKKQEVLNQADIIGEKFKEAGAKMFFNNNGFDDEIVQRKSSLFQGIGDTLGMNGEIQAAIRSLSNIYVGTSKAAAAQIREAFKEPVNFLNRQMSYITKTYNKTNEWSANAINNVTLSQAYAQDYAKRVVRMTELMQPKANGSRAIGSADAAFFGNFKAIREAYLTGLEELQHKQLVKSGSTSADVISGLLTSHKESTIYPKIIERFLGKISPEEAKAYTQFMTASALPFYNSSARDSAVNKTGFIRKFDGATPYGHLPKEYRDLYEQAYLHDNDKIPKQIAPKSSYSQRDKTHDKAFNLIQKLAEEDDTGVLNDLAVSSGLAKRTGHTITWRGNGSIPQVKNYAASLVVEFERLRKGSKQWQDNALETDRYNRRTVRLDDAIEQLAEAGVVPQLYQNTSVASNSPFNGKQIKTGAFGFPKQYIIPKTTYDEKGNLIYYEPTDEAIRVPKGQKAGVERKDQKFVGASDSAMMRMLRKIATSKGYNVDDELAYYTDNEGKKVPLMVKTSLTDVWDEARDETGWFPKEGFSAINKQTKNKVQHIGKTITNKTSMNGVPMSFGFMNEDDLYYIPTELVEEYEKQRKATPGATSFFNAGNAIPLRSFTDREALVKQLNNMHMFNTPSHGEEEYFATKAADKTKQLNGVSTEFINWTALNKLYEMKTGKTRSEADILDSLAFITPTREGDAKRRLLDSGFQGRAGTFLKFGAVLGDLPETLRKSGLMGSGFGSDGKFMVPSVAFDESNETLMHDLYRYYYGNKLPVEERMTDEERTSFASKWLRNAADDAVDLFIADTSVKSKDMGRILPKQDYEEMMKQMLKGSMPEAEISKEIQRRLSEKEKTGLINDGYVGLYGDEYTHRMNTDINFHGGIAAARETGAFEIDKRFMPISMAQSLNLPFSAYQESLNEYNKMFQNWKDPSWVMEHGFASMPAYQRELKRNPAFIESEPAKQYIQSQVAQLREHMLKQDLMLNTPAYSAMGGMTTGMALDFLSELTGNEIDKTSDFAPLFKSALLEMYNADALLKDKNISKEEKEYIRQHRDEYDETLKMIQEDKFFIAPGLKGSKAVGERFPAAYGTGVAGRNLYYNKDGTVNQRIANALKASGASEDVFYLPTQTMYKMNTGDYDGDTVWAYISKADAWLENVENIDERMKEAKAQLEARRIIQEKKEEANGTAKNKQAVESPYGEEVLRASYLNTASKAAMGLGSAVLRNALQLPDSDPNKIAAILEGAEYYDLATSQIKKAGKTDVTLGKEGFQALLVGGNFDRLMKEVFAYSNADAETRAEMVFPSIFKSNIGSLYDPNATGATLMNQVTARRAGGSFALKKKVSDYLGHVYDMGSALGRAASWYGNVRVEDLTGEHFVTDDDVIKGLELLTEVKKEQLTKGPSEQQIYDREIRAFERVLEFMQGDKARSQKNINEAIKAGPNKDLTADYIKGLEKINKGQNRGYLKEIDEVLQTERQEMIDNQILAQEMAKDEKFKEIQKTFVNDPYNPYNFPQKFSVTATEAWFDFKKLPQIKAKKQDLSPKDPRSSSYEAIFGNGSSFGNYGHRAEQEASEIMDSKEQTADIILGNYMHSAFENFWSPENKIFTGPTFAEQQKEQGQTDENLIYGYTKEELDQIAKNMDAHFMDLLSGRKKRKNEATGLMTTIKDELAEQGMDLYLTDDGTYRVQALPGERDAVQQNKLKNSIDYTNRKLESMQTVYDKDGSVLSYGSIANLARFMYKMPKTSSLRVVGTEGKIFGSNGEVLWNEDERLDPTQLDLGDGRSVRTHAKPDAVFEIDGKYYILDYKSNGKGAKDSLAQSMLYQKQYEERAEAALRAGNYDNSFAQMGYIDKNDKFVSNFGGVLGFDASGNVIFEYDGAHSALEGRGYEGRDVIDVLQEQYVEAIKSKKSDLFEGHYTAGQLELIRRKDAELAEYAAKNLIPKATITQATEAVSNAETRALDRMTTPGYSKMSDAETDFYIARYTQDKQSLDEIEKALNSENGKLFRKNHPLAGGYDRFKTLREQLDSTLGDETLDRMIEIFNSSPTVSADLRQQMTRKSDAMQKLFDVQSAYATEDVEDARKNIMSMLYGVDFSKGNQGLAGIWNQLSRARATKEGLIADPDIYNETEGFRTKANLDGLTNQTAIEMERARARKAQEAKDVYEEATGKYNSLLEFVDKSSFDKVVKVEKSEGEAQLRKILEKPLETSTIDEFFDNKVNALIGYVEQKNANIAELEKIVNDSSDQKLSSAAKDLITENRKQRNEAMEYFKDPLKFIDMIDKKSGKDGSKRSALAKIDEVYKEQEDLRAIKLAIAQGDSETLSKYGLSDEQLISKGLKYGNSTSPYDNDIVKLQEKGKTQKLNEEEEERLTNLIGKRRSFFEAFGKNAPALPTEIDQYKNTYTQTSVDAAQEAKVKEQNKVSEQYWNKWRDQNLSLVENADKLQELSVQQNTIGGANQEEIKRLTRIQQAKAARENYIEQKNDKGEYRFSELKRAELRDRYSDELIEARVKEDLEQERELGNLRSDYQFNQMMRSNRLHRMARYGNINTSMLGRLMATRQNSISQAEQRKLSYDTALSQKQTELKSIDKNTDPNRWAKVNSEVKDLSKASVDAGKEIESLSGPMGVASAAAQQFGNSMHRIVSMFGRRLFMKAINEAKQFVVQFQKSMTEIQMITLKSDDQMADLGSGLIDKAKELKISINEITQSAATLYRQGLSDEEVDERLEVISKFSKVSGTKVSDATKLITVAMNTGLVTDPRQASDIVTALGDNAATNAQQIEKGIEKAGAAAAADGTTFGQLAAMLTAITSTTQIGGNVAGRTLNTIFGRMNKIGSNELIRDENGNLISGSTVSNLLKAQGIDTYDKSGNKRSTYDILYDLSQKWDSLKDSQQQQLATAIAGTRQYSNFSAIMQGMSEGKVDEYMDLIGESSGITDKKYEIQAKSLEAALTDLRNTFNGVIQDLADKGIITNITKGISNIVTGIGSIISSAGGLSTIIPLLITLAVAMGAIRGGAPGAIVTAATLGVAAATAGIGAYVGAQQNAAKQKKTATEIYDESVQYRTERYESRKTDVARLGELSKKDSLTKEETAEYNTLISKLGKTLDIDTSSMDNASKSVDGFVGAVDSVESSAVKATEASKLLAGQISKEADRKIEEYNIKEKYNNIAKGAASVASSAQGSVDEYLTNTQGVMLKRKLKDFASSVGMEYDGTTDNLNEIIKKAIIYEEDDQLSQHEDAVSLIDYMAAYLENQSSNNIELDNEFRKKDKNYWKNRILDIYSTKILNGRMLYMPAQEEFSDSFASTAFYDMFNAEDTSGVEQRKGLYSGFIDYFTKEGVDSKYISAMAEQAVEDYYNSQEVKDYRAANNGMRPEPMQSVIERIIAEAIGKDINPDNLPEIFNNASYAYAQKTGKYSPTTEDELEQQGIEVGDYYIDTSTGAFVSAEELERNRKNYEQNKTLSMKRYAVKDKEGNIALDTNGNQLIFTQQYGEEAEVAKTNAETYIAGVKAENQKQRDIINEEASQAQTDAEQAIENVSALYSIIYPGGDKHFVGVSGKAALQDYNAGTETAARYSLDKDKEEFYKENPYVVVYNGNVSDYKKGLGSSRIHDDGEFIRYSDTAAIDRGKKYSIKWGASGAHWETDKYEDVQSWMLDYIADKDLYAYLDENGNYKIRHNRPTYEKIAETQDDLTKGDTILLDALAEMSAYGTYLKNGESIVTNGNKTYANIDGLGMTLLTKDNEFVDNNARRFVRDKIGSDYDELLYKATTRVLGEGWSNAYKVLPYDITSEEKHSVGVREALAEEMGIETSDLYKVIPISSFGVKEKLENEEELSQAAEFANAASSKASDIQAAVSGKLEAFQDTLSDTVEEIADEIIPNPKAPRLIKQKNVTNYFTGGASTAYDVWARDPKNSYATNADNMLRMIMSGEYLTYEDKDLGYQSQKVSGKYANAQRLMNYVNLAGIQEWDTLYDNAEFGRIMDQIKFDNHGQIISAPGDILEQITTFLHQNGRDYTGYKPTMQTKAQKASAALAGLTSADESTRWYSSYQARNAAIEDEYNRTIKDPWEQEYQKRLAELEAEANEENNKALVEMNKPASRYEKGIRSISVGDNNEALAEMNELISRHKKGIGLMSMDAFALKNNINYLDEYTDAYLKEFLGEELATKIKENRASGIEKAYAASIITNAQYGFSGLTDKDKVAKMQEFKDMSQADFATNWAESQDAMKNYAGGFSAFDRYAMLKSMTEEERTARGFQGEYEALEKQYQEYIDQESVKANRFDSFGATNLYAKKQYEQNNKAGLAANGLIESMAELDVLNLESFVNLVGTKQVKNWQDLIDSAPELTKKFEDLGIKIGDNGALDLSGVTDADAALASLVKILAGYSTDYSDAIYETRQDKLAKAKAFMSGNGPQGEEDRKIAEEVYGSNLVSKKLASSSNIDETYRYEWTTQDETALQNAETNYQYGMSQNEYQNYQTLKTLRDKVITGSYGTYFTHGGEEEATKAMSGSTNAQQYFKIAQRLEDNNYNIENLDQYGEKDIAKIDEILAEVEESYSSAKDVAQDFNEELLEKGVTATNKYGRSTSNVVSYLDYFSKDAKKASEASKNFNSTLNAVANNQFYRERFKQGKRDSATLSAIAEMTGIQDKEFLGKKENQSLIEQYLEQSAEKDKGLIQDWANSAAESMSETLTDAVKTQGPLQIQGQEISLTSGNVQVNFADAEAQLGGILTAEEQSIVQMLQKWGVQGFINVTGEGENVKAEIVVTGLGAGSGKGGGGGGGKSKVDKLLEKQKRKIAEIEHQNKMLEIEQKTLDFNNDYSGQQSNIDQQIQGQYKLRDAYKGNISEMEKMLKTIKKGSGDWYKLKEAIYAAQEALAEVKNTINDLNTKKIEVIVQKQENQDKPGSHNKNMLQAFAERYQSLNRFADYESTSKKVIDQTNADIALNNKQIEEWKKQLAKYEYNTDAWIDVRDKIWALQEENAELENEAIQKQIELTEARISRIATILQYNSGYDTHNQTIAETWGGAYESGGYRNEYEDMIRRQLGSNNGILADTQSALAAAQTEMASLQKGTAAWYSARDAVYQYQESIASLEVTQLELNRALAESNIANVTDVYTDATRELTHVNELLSEQAQHYLDINDYTAYYAAMESYLANLPLIIDEQRTALEALESQYQSGMENGTLDPAMQRQYLDEINNRESELQKLINELDQKEREVRKTRLDQLLEEQDFAASEYDHNIKLLGFETTKYQNNGELTNVNIMIREDIKLREQRAEALKEEIAALKEQQELFDDGSDEEQRIVEQIKKREEALASENTQIEKNNKLLEENEKKIMQVRKTLEDAVDKEIEAQKKREREILSANVNMQNTIVELLKKRLQDEWALKKKDIDKERESLNEYKKLINDRFNYRKKASQQADKEEELAEYKRQLALIESDLSRTKEAKELRRKIDDLEKENAWTVAEDEVNAESERVDEQIQGMDKFVQYNEELLNEILGDANNFATEMNDILTGSFEESYNKILEFMSKENEAFINSLPDAQKQMIQGWEDTWKKANDIVDSNYPEITSILESKDIYMDFMRNTNRDYRSYLENGDLNSMNLLERQWSEYYDNYINSIKDNATFDAHEHTLGDVISKIDELENNIFQVNVIGIDGNAPDASGFGTPDTYYRFFDPSTGEEYVPENLDSIYKQKTESTSTNTSSSSSSGSSGAKSGTVQYKATAVASFYTSSGQKSFTGVGYGKTQAEANANALENAKKAAKDAGISGQYSEPGSGVYNTNYKTGNTTIGLSNGQVAKNQVSVHGYTVKFNGRTYQKTGFASESEAKTAAQNLLFNSLYTNKPANKTDEEWTAIKKAASISAYKHGGIVDYTGPAWVDGTKARPESFLDAVDTEILRSMLDTFKFIKNTPYMSYIDPSMYGNTSTVGDINITINQAELQSDADYNEVARRVGQAFTKELSRQGLNLSGYAFG